MSRQQDPRIVGRSRNCVFPIAWLRKNSQNKAPPPGHLMQKCNNTNLLLMVQKSGIKSPVEVGMVVEIYHCFTRFEHHPSGGWPWDFWTINSRFVWKMSVFYGVEAKHWNMTKVQIGWDMTVYDDLVRSVGNLKCVENSCWNWSKNKNIQKQWFFSKDVAVWSRFMSHEFTLVLSR